MTGRYTRRQALTATGGIATTLLAGCIGGSDEERDGPEPAENWEQLQEDDRIVLHTDLHNDYEWEGHHSIDIVQRDGETPRYVTELSLASVLESTTAGLAVTGSDGYARHVSVEEDDAPYDLAAELEHDAFDYIPTFEVVEAFTAGDQDDGSGYGTAILAFEEPIAYRPG